MFQDWRSLVLDRSSSTADVTSEDFDRFGGDGVTLVDCSRVEAC